jgi:chromosome segregation ATPase
MGCFTDQVKLTRVLVRDLDEAIEEVKLLGEHEEESSQKITELEALCKKLREDTQRLEEEKATLEGMVESRDELLMEIARETGLDLMGEDEDDEEEEEDANDGGDAAAPPVAAPPPPVPLLPYLRRSMKMALWRQSLSKKSQCRKRSSWQMLSLRCRISISTMHS